MPSLPEYTPEALALKNWLEETVLADYGFRPEIIGEASLLIERHYAGSFLTALIDGLPAQAPDWAGAHNASDVLFRALGEYLKETPSHFAQVLGHDGAWWEVRRVFRPPADTRYLPYNLTLLHQDPADESGPTYLMLVADDRQSAVVLAHDPYLIPPYAANFCVVFHGSPERRVLFFSHLQKAVTKTDHILL